MLGELSICLDFCLTMLTWMAWLTVLSAIPHESVRNIDNVLILDFIMQQRSYKTIDA